MAKQMENNLLVCVLVHVKVCQQDATKKEQLKPLNVIELGIIVEYRKVYGAHGNQICRSSNDFADSGSHWHIFGDFF